MHSSAAEVRRLHDNGLATTLKQKFYRLHPIRELAPRRINNAGAWL